MHSSISKASELIQHLARGKVPQLQLSLLAAHNHFVEVGVWVCHTGWCEALRQLY